MDTELFELCKEVARTTGWKTDSFISNPADAKDKEYLYTSDYLLEKLPQFLTLDSYRCRLTVSPGGFGKEFKTPNYVPRRPYTAFWCAAYVDKNGLPPKLASGDTALIALLKLTLALHEAGELK